MKILNKLIYADIYRINPLSTQEITIPKQPPFNEYIINKDKNTQYIIFIDYNLRNFNINNIKRKILIKKDREDNEGDEYFFTSLINFNFFKEDNSIFLKNIKKTMYRLYMPEISSVNNPSEYISLNITNLETDYLIIYLEFRELTAVLL